MVAGSSGAYFYIADTVIRMDSYRPSTLRNR
ncbi:MAG: P-loop domain-containing protein [Eisenbergiella sp.]